MDTKTAADIIVALLVVLAILLVWTVSSKQFDRFTLRHTKSVRSSVDGLTYRVHTVHGNPDEAANTMAALNQKVIELLRYLRVKYLRGPAGQKYPARAAATRRLLDLYNPDNLAENSPRDPDGDTSYTIDKGAILALCLREKDPARRGGLSSHDIHDLNTLTFVTFHELTHIAIKEIDHPPIFWQTFKFVLQDAADAGLLRPVNYEHTPAIYCGMNVDYNPLYDHSLRVVE